MPISTTLSVVDLKNQIAAVRSALIDAMNTSSNIIGGNNGQVPALRSKLAQLEDQLADAQQAERSAALYAPAAQQRSSNGYQLKSRTVMNDLFRSYLKHGEKRGLNTSDGGVLIPQNFEKDYVSRLAYFGPIAGLVRRVDGTGPVKLSESDDVSNGFNLVGETNSTVGTAADPTLSANIWQTDALVSRCSFTFQQIEDNGFDLIQFLNDNVALRDSRSLEKAITTGKDFAGNALPNSPVGGFLAGVATGATVAASNAISFDDISALRASVNHAYRVGACYMASQSVADYLADQKDSTGSPLYKWSDDGKLLLFGQPLEINASMPALNAASGSKLLVYGNYARAYVYSTGQLGIRVLLENVGSVENNKKTLIAFRRVGACSLLQDAVHALLQK